MAPKILITCKIAYENAEIQYTIIGADGKLRYLQTRLM